MVYTIETIGIDSLRFLALIFATHKLSSIKGYLEIHIILTIFHNEYATNYCPTGP